MKVAILSLISILFPPLAFGGADQPIDVRVRPAFARAPAEVLVTVFVEPEAELRELKVAAESPEYYRASTISLHGSASARTHQFAWRAFPAGEYIITATVRDAGGRESIMQARLEVMP